MRPLAGHSKAPARRSTRYVDRDNDRASAGAATRPDNPDKLRRNMAACPNYAPEAANAVQIAV